MSNLDCVKDTILGIGANTVVISRLKFVSVKPPKVISENKPKAGPSAVINTSETIEETINFEESMFSNVIPITVKLSIFLEFSFILLYLLATTTLGGCVYPYPPSKRTTSSICPLKETTSALAPPPFPSTGIK